MDLQVDRQVIAKATGIMIPVGPVGVGAAFFIKMEQVFGVENVGVLWLAVKLTGQKHMSRSDKLVKQQPAFVIG